MIKLARFTVVSGVIISLLLSLPAAGFCGITLTTIMPKPTYHPKWTPLSVDPTQSTPLGNLPTSGSLSYTIPSAASSAVEILVCVWAYLDQYNTSNAGMAWKVYTEETSANGGTQYAQFFYCGAAAANYGAYTYSSCYNSACFWLPVTSEGLIHIAFLKSLGNGAMLGNSGVFVIGYR